MKYLEAKRAAESGGQENKMLPGSRPDQGGEQTDPMFGLAKSMGIDINDVKGTGRGGRVTRKDLDDYLASKDKNPGSVISGRQDR